MTTHHNPIGIAILLLVFLAVASGCAHQPKVSYQFDSKTDFASFKTYALEPTDSPTLGLRMLNGKPMTQTIQESIEQALDARGLRKVAAANQPDLLVRWRGAIEYEAASADLASPTVNVDLDRPDSGAILDSGPAGGMGTPAEITNGGIRIDLVSALTKQTVWRGGVGAVLRSKTPDPERVARLNAALAKLFANYPPKAAPAR
jgi:hypothetical protein